MLHRTLRSRNIVAVAAAEVDSSDKAANMVDQQEVLLSAPQA